MLRVRRLYLLPAFIITCALYFFLQRAAPSSSKTPAPIPIDKGKVLLWHERPQRYPVTSFIPLPSGAAAKIPKIQHESFVAETVLSRKRRLERRDAVRSTFLRSWNGYKTYAWGKDEVSPVSGTWRSSFGGWGATLIDAMDTLWIMGLKDDFELCVMIVEGLDFSTNEEDSLNVFETTIRYLGGLLAAYDVSERKYPILLKKARELADILYVAFDTPHRMPVTRWRWMTSAKGEEVFPGETTLVAELGSLNLEFTRLAQLTGEMKYFDAVQRITNELQRMQNTTAIPGLWPVVIDLKGWPTKATYRHFTLGGMADSAYEYLPKEYLMLSGRGDEGKQLRNMYETAVEMAKQHIFFRPMTEGGDDVLLSGNVVVSKDGNVTLDPQGQHLACFTGGMVGIGARIFERPDDLEVAKRLVAGCIWAYRAMPTGMMPETFHAVPCHTGVGKAEPGECDWSESKWYQAIRNRHHLETESDVPTQEKLVEFAEARRLVPGFADIGDKRYILRWGSDAAAEIWKQLTVDVDQRLSNLSSSSTVSPATKRIRILPGTCSRALRTQPERISRTRLSTTLRLPHHLILIEWNPSGLRNRCGIGT